MRWSYKTVHYAMKKEGLLGSAFLDESEIELSLNEYGKAGWELVSILETLDGLIAIFKQPISLGGRSLYGTAVESSQVSAAPRLVKGGRETKVEPPSRFEEKKGNEEEDHEIVLVDEYEDMREEPRVMAPPDPETPPDSSDVGSIRIE